MSVIDKLSEGKYSEAISQLKATAKANVEDSYKEYRNDRTIRDTQVGRRQDKRTKNGIVKRAKIPIPFQRKIVQSAAVFLFGSPIKLVTEENNTAWEAISSLWKKTRMDAKLLDFCKAVKSETEAAIVFYPVMKETDSEATIKARLLTKKDGRLYTNFDAYGDLVAFGWEYTGKDSSGKDVTFLRIWTEEKEMTFIGNTLIDEFPNEFGKIPVVYLSQEFPEWHWVEDMIDRFEMSNSKFADTNDYFAHPMFKAKGNIESMPKKDETGKMITLPIHETGKGNIVEADVEFLTWEHAPEAIKLESETLKGLIYSLSDTPDLSFDNVKGLGNVSGVALKLMFLAPIMKSYEDQGDYSTAVSRIINVMKAGIANITSGARETELEKLDIDIQFTSILPDNLLETVQILTEANGGKPIMSQETSVASNPLVTDSDEMEKIKAEREPDNPIPETFNL